MPRSPLVLAPGERKLMTRTCGDDIRGPQVAAVASDEGCGAMLPIPHLQVVELTQLRQLQVKKVKCHPDLVSVSRRDAPHAHAVARVRPWIPRARDVFTGLQAVETLPCMQKNSLHELSFSGDDLENNKSRETGKMLSRIDQSINGQRLVFGCWKTTD